MSLIKNKTRLAKTSARKKILEVVEAGFAGINLDNVLKAKIKRKGSRIFFGKKSANLNDYERIFVCGIGKCSLAAAKYLEKLLGSKIRGGLVIDVKSEKLKRIKSFKGSHPLPSTKNFEASRKLLKLVKSLNPQKDLLIFIVSGGGSSLFFLPDGIKPKDFSALSLDLLKSGATIQEFNCVRKHLSFVQGGKLAALIYPLPTVALYFSDVISETGNKNLMTIASGPLFFDDKKNKDARKVLEKYKLWKKYKNKIEYFSDTVKNKSFFKNIKQELLLTNETALLAMDKKAKQLQLKPKILTLNFLENVDQAYFKIRLLSAKDKKHNLFLAGGEMKIQVKGRGKGGRNQHAALAALENVKDNEVFVCFASDGIDNTEFAGAIADKQSRQKAKTLGLSAKKYLKNNDSFTFFKKTGDYLETGFTGTNVSDLIVYYRD
ncbi:MAG: hypothetical protein UX26_C0005G0008 [Parcubacteria group bacterium GW2011_GWC1_45_9]|nr:MAG: hypothetical protein UW85_C0001G0047 [Parcubacteria group bacterium GW2011_GWA1_Parcubacteria_45_10]KKT89290.1 MAG: hypothetical protein UW89_C0001G0018 [Parcubacteria group bacterium GW2011_GWB1_45_10]KKU17212.1 MAG: hypothetical protein UX26_C0005G0008 [Parcubacteria group bacterium GW2011_GWC1_45_9]